MVKWKFDKFLKYKYKIIHSTGFAVHMTNAFTVYEDRH